MTERLSHSYGPTCAFYDAQPRKDASSPETDSVPPVKAQFFYVSALPIDDPLSPLPPISDKSSEHEPQPFSVRDNAALEEAWQGLRAGEDAVRPSSRHMDKGMFSFPRFREGRRHHSQTSARSGERGQETQNGHAVSADTTPGRKPAEPSSSASNKRKSSGSPAVNTPELENGLVLNSPDEARGGLQQASQSDVMLSQPVTDAKEQSTRRTSSPFRRATQRPPYELLSHVQDEHLSNDISGRPFARAPSAKNISQRLNNFDSTYGQAASESPPDDAKDAANDDEKLPQHGPIYWSPVNDTSSVLRATWFYKDTMLPVPTTLANRLELGYEYIKPYSDSYKDELQACIDNGAAAEAKLVYKLWTDTRKTSRPSSAADQLESKHEEPSPIPVHGENVALEPALSKKKQLFQTHSAIYVDRENAQILRPSLLPSTSKNRRPLSSIRKGRQIGVAVVRGFDRKLWMKLHPDPKLREDTAAATVGGYMAQSGDATTKGRRMSCAACDERYKTPVVKDLVLVIHGIGQKLSQRVDSYHFTHAINDLRRSFNVEIASQATKGNVETNTSMMVLPVNWRLTVSFDDKEEERSEEERFGLEDITPDTLPAVRSIISDVMLDIPYYMSHHKEKMTSAVIREANRVYRLWCRNNPGFREHGRVHLIAHSLGSAMAMDILSQQPTKVPTDADVDEATPSQDIFEFNTTNLFCCGSPGGFFLLLNNAHLVPRAGIEKPGMEAESHTPGISSEQQYGSLAVQNIYNVLNKNDPVSYLLNASVDAAYASLLQPANIPTASQSLFGRLGSSLRWSKMAGDPYASHNIPARPQIAHLPSTVELDTHNFTREEIAEKRMYLLNENGQIDFHLASGGGPLEIQYLSMLSAHSSYWVSKDFVRFLVLEIGRKAGKENTLPVLRAVKKREYKRGSLA
ncbi:putative phospholipase [Cyphellophora attinorum]|uniref:Putative phospholipase n=1 Tax=Cyphellophora attinorum TaxID=1664694 RepID=A0A0N0NLL4_9EURO|nr:putative phospholipase [Phialophora attinorum]KPI39169.1 putative phospholipase [Phialophora attinorum]